MENTHQCQLIESLILCVQRLKAQYLDLLIEVRRQIAARAASGNQGEQEQDRTLKMLRGADRAVAMLLARHPGHARAIFQNFGKSVDEFEQEVCSLMSYWLKAAPHAMVRMVWTPLDNPPLRGSF